MNLSIYILIYFVLNFSQVSNPESIMVSIEYDQMRYNPLVRKQQFDMLDFFSYFGGLLGLFAGISILSIVEIIYWFTIQLLRCRSDSIYFSGFSLI